MSDAPAKTAADFMKAHAVSCHTPLRVAPAFTSHTFAIVNLDGTYQKYEHTLRCHGCRATWVEVTPP